MLPTHKPHLLPWILTILVTLSAGGLLSWQARQLYQQMTQLAVSPPAPPSQPSRPAPQLLQRLFGDPSSPAVADLQGVTLLGCIVAADPRQSQALVRIDGQGALSVFPGDEFLPGVRVREIGHDHLLFTRNGGSGRLEFAARDAMAAAQGEPR